MAFTIIVLGDVGSHLDRRAFALRSSDAANPQYPAPGQSALPNFTQPSQAQTNQSQINQAQFTPPPSQPGLPSSPSANVLRPANKAATPTRIPPPATGAAAPLRDPFVRPAQNLVPVEPQRLPDNMAARPMHNQAQGQARLTSDETPANPAPAYNGNLLSPSAGNNSGLLMPGSTPSPSVAAPNNPVPAPTASPYSLNNTPSASPTPVAESSNTPREPRPLSAFDDRAAPIAKPEGYAAPAQMNPVNSIPLGGAPAQSAASPYSTPAPLSNEPPRIAASMNTGNAGVKPLAMSGSAKPGDKRLDGAQAPQLTIEKVFPAEVIVGKPAAVLIRVRNAGTVTAQDVTLTDPIPEGMQFHKAQPATQPNARGELQWSLGALSPGQESTVSVELIPQAEGELGSVASVAFRSEASGRTISVRPQLALQVSSPRSILAGQELVLSIKITNPGSGTATNVVLEEHVPRR